MTPKLNQDRSSHGSPEKHTDHFERSNSLRVQSNFLRVIILWLPLALITTLLSGLIFNTVRQSIRQAADDPQIEMAEDTAAALNAGVRPQSIIPAGRINIAQSLAPYLIIYNQSRYPLISSGVLDDRIPVPPSTAFKEAASNGKNRITWEPKPGVRSAVTIVPYQGNPPGYVLAGRSLREVEKREQQIYETVFWGWLITNLGSLGWLLLCRNQLFGKSYY